MLDGYVPPLLVLGLAGLLLAPFFLRRRTVDWAAAVAIMLAVIASAAVLERQMGRPVSYTKGPVRFWIADVLSDQNSQQVADPYSFTHVTHGALFYGMTVLALGPARPALRAAVAVALESAWEALENTNMVIDRYRAVTVSLGYYGDSVFNSVGDTLACVVGFFFAAKLPVRATVWTAIGLELLLTLWIRDSLLLNIVMLIHPIEAVKTWQLEIAGQG